MTSDANRGLLPGEDFGRRVSVIFSRCDSGLLLSGLDGLCQDRLRYLLAGAEANSLIQSSQFQDAIQRTPLLVGALVDRGLPLDCMVSLSKTPLGFALSLCHADLAHALLDRGASLDFVAKNASALGLLALSLKEGAPPSREATAVALARELLERGASVDGNMGSVSPLLICASTGNFPFTEVLLEAGASMSRNPMGHTPLQVARANRHDRWAAAVEAWWEAKSLEASTDHAPSKTLRRSL